MLKHFLLSAVLLFVVPFGLTACASKEKEGDSAALTATAEETQTVEALYNEAADAMDRKELRKAVQLFQEVEQKFPYSKWATKAQLMAAYAAYQEDSYNEAILSLDRFIELHPGSEDIDYAYYLKALAYYEQITDVARDQEMTQQALKSFDALITRFPTSKYARDSCLKKDLTLDHLAGKEMEIGRYYLKRNQINAAINRFRTVVQDYQTTTHTAEALHRLVEAYLTLGLKSEAIKIAAVLGHNYPGSKWYEDTYKLLDPASREEIMKNRSFFDKTVESLFNRE